MLNSQHVASRRLVHSARQLYFFQQRRKEHELQANDAKVEEKEDNKVYILGYN